MKVAIGIDIGGTSIKGAVLDERGIVLSEKFLPTDAKHGADRVLQNIQNIVESFLASPLPFPIQAIGIGTPGLYSFEKRRVVEGAYQLPDWKNFPFVDKIFQKYRVPTHADNDANVMSYGEFRFGSAKNSTHAICITLGTGIGGGIILNKKIHRGHFEYAGEIGHMITNLNGRKCACGSRGCWEAHASATGLIQDAKERGYPWLPQSEVKDIFVAEKAHDPLCQLIVNTYMDHLAIGITNLVRIYDPEVFVIGGGISPAVEERFDKLLSKIDALKMKNTPMRCDFKIAQLGNKAGVVGAAAIAMDSL